MVYTELMNRPRILTGDRPTGKLHLGHYVGSLANRVQLQESGQYDQFIMIADMQALTDHADHPDMVRANVVEVVLDYLAVGLDPQKTTFFIQSLVPEIAELTMYFLNLVTVARLNQNPTVKTEMRQKGFEQQVPAGFLTYPVSQAADILAFKPAGVPVGEDQLPMIELANEIVEKFNRLYGPVFEKTKALVSGQSRLPGIDGKQKMSKSLHNAIYLSDSRQDIDQKVMSMYTDPHHVHVSDPGAIEGNVVFAYLDIFDNRYDEVADLKRQYQQGGLGDIAIKKRLIDVLDVLIAPFRERRAAHEKNRKRIMEMLLEGSRVARGVASETLQEVRASLHIDYTA